MQWKCLNCGKRVELSDEQLTETRGVVVCPQCLSSDKVRGYDTPRPKPTLKPQESPKPRQKAPAMTTPPPHKSPPTPPPHRAKISFSDKSSSTDAPPAKPKKSSGKKKKKGKKSSSGSLAPKSTLGCLWRSVVYTLLFLIIYIIFGVLLQGV